MRPLLTMSVLCGLAIAARGEGWIELSQPDFPVVISQPGHYRLTENIKQTAPQHGITIEADHVTIDLGGFVLEGTYDVTLSGIFADARQNIVVQNGSVVGWGESGIDTLTSMNCTFRNVRALRNHEDGIHSGMISLVVDCLGSFNGVGQPALQNDHGNGIIVDQTSIVLDSGFHGNNNHGVDTASGVELIRCVSSRNAHDSIHAGQANVIGRCITWRNERDDGEVNMGSVVFESVFHINDDGLKARDEDTDNELFEGRCVFHRCTSVSNKDGFAGEDGTLFAFCNAHDNKDDGFTMESYSLVYRCLASKNGFVDTGTPGGGINFDGPRNMAIGNHVVGNEHGITSSNVAAAIRNIAVQNSARGNTLGQFSLRATDYRGPYTNRATTASAWANFRW